MASHITTVISSTGKPEAIKISDDCSVSGVTKWVAVHALTTAMCGVGLGLVILGLFTINDTVAVAGGGILVIFGGGGLVALLSGIGYKSVPAYVMSSKYGTITITKTTETQDQIEICNAVHKLKQQIEQEVNKEESEKQKLKSLLMNCKDVK